MLRRRSLQRLRSADARATLRAETMSETRDNAEDEAETTLALVAFEEGRSPMGAVGTCWGSYVVLRLAEDVGFQAGVSFHPSHSPIAGSILQVKSQFYIIFFGL
mgnify:CR=1 FL=1